MFLGKPIRVSWATPVNETTDAVTLTYDPWGGARLDDAVGELERQGGRVVADCEGIRADEPTETHTGVAY